MTLSVNSATSALAALQALQTTHAPASPVSTPAAAIPKTAQHAVSSVSTSIGSRGLYGVIDAMGQAMSAVDAAGAAGSSVLSMLQTMRQGAAQAADPATSAGARQVLDHEFQAKASGVGAVLAAARVNGSNLVDGSLATPMRVSLGEGASATLTPQDLTLGGPTLQLAGGTSLATATAAASAFQALGGAIGATNTALSTLQAQGQRITAHGGALLALSQALASPQDDSGDSARLLALQVGQQLSGVTTAIANQTPQTVLSLLRS